MKSVWLSKCCSGSGVDMVLLCVDGVKNVSAVGLDADASIHDCQLFHIPWIKQRRPLVNDIELTRTVKTPLRPLRKTSRSNLMEFATLSAIA